MKELNDKNFYQLIAGLIIFKIVLIILLIFNIPQVKDFNHFPIGGAGDGEDYFQVAKNFSEFKAIDVPNFGTIGAALVYVPYIWLTGADQPQDIYIPVFLVQQFILFTISVFLVAYIAKKFFKNNLLGIITATIYIVYPYLIYPLNIGPYTKNYTIFSDAIWLRPLLSDAPSALFTYLAVALFFYGLDKKEKVKDSIYTGITAGFASLIRITNILICAAIVITELLQKKYKQIIIFSTVAFLVFSMQLWFNYYNYGDPFNFSKIDPEIVEQLEEHYYKSVDPSTIEQPRFHPLNYLHALVVIDKYIPFFELVLILLIVSFILTGRYLYKKYSTKAVFILLWFILYAVIYGAFGAGVRNFRYWLPIVPAVLILIIGFLLMLKDAYCIFKSTILKRHEKIANNNSRL